MGVSNVSTRAVARLANENIGSIHSHFGGENQLFEATAREATRRFNAYSISQAIEPFLNLSIHPPYRKVFCEPLYTVKPAFFSIRKRPESTEVPSII